MHEITVISGRAQELAASSYNPNQEVSIADRLKAAEAAFTRIKSALNSETDKQEIQADAAIILNNLAELSK